MIIGGVMTSKTDLIVQPQTFSLQTDNTGMIRAITETYEAPVATLVLSKPEEKYIYDCRKICGSCPQQDWKGY